MLNTNDLKKGTQIMLKSGFGAVLIDQSHTPKSKKN